MVSYLKQAPAGFLGDITRPDNSVVEPAMLVPVGGTTFPTEYGIPLKQVSGGVQQYNGGAETGAEFAGVLVRQAPSIAGSVASDSAAMPSGGTPNGEQVQGMLIAGYVAVKCARGTPARGGIVYVQIVANGGVAVGEFCATDDGSNAIALTLQQAQWATDGVDANSVAELRVQF